MLKRTLIILVIFLLTGCTDPVKEDLFNYVNQQLPNTTSIENEVINLYEQNKNESNFYNVLNDEIIPKYSNFIKSLKDINPNTDKINEIHSLYINGAKKQLDAFKLIKSGLEDKNNESIIEANSLLLESKQYMNDFKEALINLAKSYNLKIK